MVSVTKTTEAFLSCCNAQYRSAVDDYRDVPLHTAVELPLSVPLSHSIHGISSTQRFYVAACPVTKVGNMKVAKAL